MLLVELRHTLTEFNHGYIFRLDRVPEPLRDVPIFEAADFNDETSAFGLLPLVYVTEGEANAALRSANDKRPLDIKPCAEVRTTSLRRLLGER
jgi:hypothetical protein